MYIYVDILIVTSVYIDFLIIKASAALMHRRPANRRCILGALAGSLFSLCILLPPMGKMFDILFRLISAAVIVLTVFGYGNAGRFFSMLGTFFAVSCLFAGICVAIPQLFGKTVLSRNGGIYINIPLMLLLCSTAAAYGAARLIRGISSSDKAAGIYTVTVTSKEISVSFPAAADSGNFLKDPITGAPVIVCPAEKLSPMFPAYEPGRLPRGWRLIPYDTAAGSGMMAIFRPENIIVCAEGENGGEPADAYIGAAPYPMEYAVFHPSLIS